jgi:two-component system KDP operon response regulator KdpE
MSNKQRILIVDDEPQITRVLRAGLAARGYDTRTAAEGESALDTYRDWTPDLVITDLCMPNVDGLELCRRLRMVSQVPIIVLSVRGEERDKVGALDLGADDYVTKPFSINELLARVRAALRRVPAVETPAETALAAGDFRLDLSEHRAWVRGCEVRLTPKEFALLAQLMQSAGRVLHHKTLLAAVWGQTYADQTETLRVFIGQLRKKVERDAAAPRYILTEPWVGYRFNPGPQASGGVGEQGSKGNSLRELAVV